MVPRSQNVPAAPDDVRYCPRPNRYVFSRLLNALRDKLLSGRVDGKLLQNWRGRRRRDNRLCVQSCLVQYCMSYTVCRHAVSRVKPSFVIFDIRALWRSALSVRVPGCQKLQMATRLVVGVGKYEHITSVLRDVLHWLPVSQTIQLLH